MTRFILLKIVSYGSLLALLIISLLTHDWWILCVVPLGMLLASERVIVQVHDFCQQLNPKYQSVLVGSFLALVFVVGFFFITIGRSGLSAALLQTSAAAAPMMMILLYAWYSKR